MPNESTKDTTVRDLHEAMQEFYRLPKDQQNIVGLCSTVVRTAWEASEEARCTTVGIQTDPASIAWTATRTLLEDTNVTAPDLLKTVLKLKEAQGAAWASFKTTLDYKDLEPKAKEAAHKALELTVAAATIANKLLEAKLSELAS
jgi:hypothetical protein